MSTIIESIEQRQLRRVPRFDAGDRVRVHFQVIEGTRKRTQVFEGIVIGRQGSGSRETFLVGKRARVAERRWGIEDDLVLGADDEAVPLDSEGEAQEEVEDVPPEAESGGEEAEETAQEPEAEAAEGAQAEPEA